MGEGGGREVGPVDSNCNWKNRFVAMSSVVLDSRVSSNEFLAPTYVLPFSRFILARREQRGQRFPPVSSGIGKWKNSSKYRECYGLEKCYITVI